MKKVEVSFLFSKNNKIGSYIIRLFCSHLTKNTPYKFIPSHVAILVKDRVFEATTLDGIKISKYNKWTEYNKKLYKIPFKDCELNTIIDLHRKIQNKKYDFAGVLYFAIRILINLVGMPIPSINKWQSDDKYFCTEVAGSLADIDCQMMSPVQLKEKLMQQQIKWLD